MASWIATALPGRSCDEQISLPINDLPDDVLLEIWSNVIGLTCHHDEDSYKASGRLLISHICRHWRTLALSSPFLWTRIQLISPQYTSMMIQRCGQALFSVLFLPNGMSRAQLSLCMKHVLQQGDRLRRLDMTHTPILRHALTNCLNRGLGVSPPVLDTVVMRYRFEWSTNILDASTHLPLPVAARNVRNLRVDTGTTELVKALMGAFPCITNLTVSFNPYQIPTLNAILDMLRMLPRLERLHLSIGTIDPRRISQLPLNGEPQVVRLNLLRCLVIDHLCGVHILDFLILPATTSIVVNVPRDADFRALTSAEMLLQKIVTSTRGPTKPYVSGSMSPFTTAMLNYEEDFPARFTREVNLILRLWSSSQPRTAPDLQGANVTINLSMLRYSRTQFNTILDWVNPLPSITAVILMVEMPNEFRYSTALFKLFPNASTMMLDGKRHQTFWRWPSSKAPHKSLVVADDQRSPERLLAGLTSGIREGGLTLPHLQELILSNLNWCRNHRGADIRDHGQRIEPLIDRLLEVFHMRSQAGLRLGKIIIDTPYNLDSTGFELLNSVVGVDQVEKTSESRFALCSVCRFLKATST